MSFTSGKHDGFSALPNAQHVYSTSKLSPAPTSCSSKANSQAPAETPNAVPESSPSVIINESPEITSFEADDRPTLHLNKKQLMSPSKPIIKSPLETFNAVPEPGPSIIINGSPEITSFKIGDRPTVYLPKAPSIAFPKSILMLPHWDPEMELSLGPSVPYFGNGPRPTSQSENVIADLLATPRRYASDELHRIRGRTEAWPERHPRVEARIFTALLALQKRMVFSKEKIDFIEANSEDDLEDDSVVAQNHDKTTPLLPVYSSSVDSPKLAEVADHGWEPNDPQLWQSPILLDDKDEWVIQDDDVSVEGDLLEVGLQEAEWTFATRKKPTKPTHIPHPPLPLSTYRLSERSYPLGTVIQCMWAEMLVPDRIHGTKYAGQWAYGTPYGGMHAKNRYSVVFSDQPADRIFKTWPITLHGQNAMSESTEEFRANHAIMGPLREDQVNNTPYRPIEMVDGLRPIDQGAWIWFTRSQHVKYVCRVKVIGRLKPADFELLRQKYREASGQGMEYPSW
ncbi:hypothetical protein EJ08DRAFT_693817 [Tothia fuscella]|uniref:Uncharacterized protein n=1 Tax=Tothia fuscella TaxID=1048955 RepID=A0A9P4NXL3_9PEZI|nr:hypothetical protein EJ08DRAFT_693817 [Tothia fuscella]